MECVVQEDEYGCGVACVAAVLGITYRRALNLFDTPQNASLKGFFCKDIVKVLTQRNKAYFYFYIKSYKRKRIYSEGTIVFIKKNSTYPAGHYISRINGRWVDPWLNYPSIPRTAGMRKKLPGIPIYAIQPTGELEVSTR